MLFNSVEYLLFLPGIVLLFFLLPYKYRWILLLTASYFFYMYWRPSLGLLLLTSTVIDYTAAIQMEKAQSQRRKFWLLISLFTNLSLLAAFKYLGFFSEMLHDLFSFLHGDVELQPLQLLLPIGISFYTFQTLSYTIDIYRNRRKAEHHFGIFALYVSFFPQLIAGPIERSTKLLPQFRKPTSFSWQRLADGGRLIAWGLFKKVLIADTIGIYTIQVFQSMDSVGGAFLFLTFIAFGAQIYYDFAGYTDIAIGSAKIMGYDLMSNFERPYTARSISDLWSRWHISFTSWLFDYLYRPLAKSYRLTWQVNILILFLVMGLWHGAGWGFIIFGLLNGIYFIISYYLEQLRMPFAGKSSIFNKIFSFSRSLVIVILVNFSLGFWTVGSLQDAQLIFEKIFTSFSLDHFLYFKLEDVVLFAVTWPVVIYVEMQHGYRAKQPFHTVRSKWIRWGLYYYIILFLIMFGDKSAQEFYYFQF